MSTSRQTQRINSFQYADINAVFILHGNFMYSTAVCLQCHFLVETCIAEKTWKRTFARVYSDMTNQFTSFWEAFPTKLAPMFLGVTL